MGDFQYQLNNHLKQDCGFDAAMWDLRGTLPRFVYTMHNLMGRTNEYRQHRDAWVNHLTVLTVQLYEVTQAAIPNPQEFGRISYHIHQTTLRILSLNMSIARANLFFNEIMSNYYHMMLICPYLEGDSLEGVQIVRRLVVDHYWIGTATIRQPFSQQLLHQILHMWNQEVHYMLYMPPPPPPPPQHQH